jgi:hypothetical protein
MRDHRYGPHPDCPIPPLFFTAVNVPMFWLVGPLAALLSPRHPLIGLTLYGVISVNAIVHVVSGLATGAFYNPGCSSCPGSQSVSAFTPHIARERLVRPERPLLADCVEKGRLKR